MHKLLVFKLHIIMEAPDLQVNKCDACYQKMKLDERVRMGETLQAREHESERSLFLS